MTTTLQESLTLNLTDEIDVRASLEATFEARLVQMGPENETPDGKPLPMILEPRPGGRCFRDLGNNEGHLWGFVQSIKRPTLIEITGLLLMSLPVVSHIQYRLKEKDGGTLITFEHLALGVVPDDYRQGLTAGWGPLSSVSGRKPRDCAALIECRCPTTNARRYRRSRNAFSGTSRSSRSPSHRG